MNQLKRKIFLDLFITPSVMIPTLISSTLFLMGWGVDYMNLMFLGIVGLLGSAGFASYRFLFNFEQVADKVSIAFRNQRFNEWKNKLNQLNRKLIRTDGEEDENCLATLKTAYSELLEDIRENKLSQYLATNTSEEVEMWFEQCVEKLERSYELWDALKTSTETVKKDLVQKRKILLEHSTLIMSPSACRPAVPTHAPLRCLPAKKSI